MTDEITPERVNALAEEIERGNSIIALPELQAAVHAELKRRKEYRAAHTFKAYDRVKHKDGREGMVERVTGHWISVQFEHHARTSVVLNENLTRIPKEGTDA